MDELEARIDALERAVTEGDHDLSELAAEGETRERLAAVETELGDLADRVAELEAATQALRGYVGNVRAVNRDVEQRADAALAKAESLESAIADDDPTGDRAERDHGTPTPDPAGGATPFEADGRSPESSPFEADGRSPESSTATEGEHRPESTNGTADAPTAADSPPAGSHGNGHGGTGHERCAACGRPTGDGTADDTAASGRDRRPSAVGRETDGTDDPLDGVFEADGGHENGDGGTFDRIREML